MNTKISNRMIALLMMAIPLLNSCKKEELVENQGIYPAFVVSYDAKKNQTTVNAYLKQGGNFGNNVIPNKKAPVVVNNEPMNEKTVTWIAGPFYEKVINGFQPDITFAWTDKEGITHNETIAVEPIHFKPFEGGLQIKNSAKFEWDGNPVSINQTVQLSTVFGKWTQDIKGENSLTVNQDGLNIPIEQLPLTKFVLERKTSKPIMGSKGLNGQMTYAYLDEKMMKINFTN